MFPQRIAILVEVENPIKPPYNHDEAVGMLNTCGYNLQQVIVQNRHSPSARFFMGEGRAKEISNELPPDRTNYTVVFNHNLTSSQIQNLAELMKVRVIDRRFLILEIFELHSTTRESKLQIQLARLQTEYALRKIETSSRERGERPGRDFAGKGYTDISALKRDFRRQEGRIRGELEGIERQRSNQRKLRVKEGVYSIIGYTNVGKSAILNKLTKSDLPSQDELFTTLTTTTRQFSYKGNTILLTDTVGFIADLPENLLQAFMTTLDEINYSQGILHVVDISQPLPEILKKIRVSQEILTKIGAFNIPVLYVFNKIDKLHPAVLESITSSLRKEFPNSVFVSALTGQNFDQLIESIISLHRTEKISKEGKVGDEST